MFGAAFMFLAAAAIAAALAQFAASDAAPWVSMAYSFGAVVCTVAAVWLGRGRRERGGR